jgi:hypothetical protein
MKKNNLIRNTLIASIAVMALGTGCSDPTNENVVEFGSFQKEYQLHSEVVEWLDIWNCTDLRIYDSILVAIDWKREKIFRVYNIDSKILISTFGTYGEGPQEFFHCPKLTPVFYFEGKDLIIQLWDWGRSTLLNINLSKSIKESRLVEKSKYVLPDDFMTSKPFMTNDLRIFGVDQRGILEMLDPVSKEIIKFNEPIQINQKLPTPNFEEIARMMYIEPAPSP